MTLPPPMPPQGTIVTNQPMCSRHPNRPAGRNCTRCGRPACTDCLVTAPIGSQCRECIKAGPNVQPSRWKRRATSAMPVTVTLIAINLIMFVADFVLFPAGGGSAGPLHDRLDLYEYLVHDGQVYRLFTYGFMHFGLIHIALNMYMLFVLGRLTELPLGSLRFSLLYFASLVGGALGSVAMSPTNYNVAGASGAIFGLLGAAVIGEWRFGANPIRTQLGTLLVINIAFTFLFPGIAIGGHLGGLVVGGLCGFVLLAPRQKLPPSWAQIGIPLVIILVCVAAGFALSTPLPVP